MTTRTWRWAACGLLFGSLAVSPAPAKAGDTHKTMYLTFNHPVRLPGVVLGSGTYLFEVPDPISAWTVVRVSSASRERVYFSSFTRLVNRPRGLSRRQVVSFGEARADVAQPIAVWWPADESTGREFIYNSRDAAR